MSAMGEEYRRDTLRRTVLYLYPEYSVFREAYMLSSAAAADEAAQMPEQVYELDLHIEKPDDGQVQEPVRESVGIQEQAETGPISSAGVRREIYVVGGDYFMPEELRNVQDRDNSSLGTVHDTQVSGDRAEFTDGA